MAREFDFSKARRGPALPPPKGKTRITIYIDDDVLGAFRDQAEAEGRGYQTAMNDALRRSLPVASSRQDALLARLNEAIADVLRGVKVVDTPRARSIAKRAPAARKVEPAKPARKPGRAPKR